MISSREGANAIEAPLEIQSTCTAPTSSSAQVCQSCSIHITPHRPDTTAIAKIIAYATASATPSAPRFAACRRHNFHLP